MKAATSLRVAWAGIVCAGLVLALAGTGCGNNTVTAPAPTPPLSFDNFQPASVVVGQADMISGAPNAGGSIGPVGLRTPYGAGAGAYYFADRGNNRVLGFDGVPSGNGTPASFVLGQPDFISGSLGTTAQKFYFPMSCAVSGGKLFVADSQNNRVLIWNTLPTGDVPADVVVGQSDFTSSAAAATRTGLNRPTCVVVAAGKLIVADYFNRRVMIWNSIPTTNDAPADVEVGQPDFTTSTVGLTASKVSDVSFVWSDGVRLAISDETNGRVLIWKHIPSGTNGVPADVVVGAPDFVTKGGGIGANTVGIPQGLASDGTSLFVADKNNSRVLIFTPFPTANGASASRVLGQGDFTHFMYNDDNQDGTQDGHPTARTLFTPAGLRISGRRLLVADWGNNRLLIFKGK